MENSINVLPGSDKPTNLFLKMRPIHRLMIGAGLVLLTWVLTRNIIANPLVMVMVLWDVFCIGVLGCLWIVFFTCSPALMRVLARKEDGSRLFVLLLILISSLASMVTVVFLIFSGPSPHKALYTLIAIAGMLLSWTMVHTTFCVHYAHLFYDDDADEPKKHAGGLDFPGDDPPDYFDFAYFSFVIGMTFQVSDVQISSRFIRRQALVHGLLAFALNTFVVALTVNLIAGLK